jgi:hypothetical protein
MSRASVPSTCLKDKVASVFNFSVGFSNCEDFGIVNELGACVRKELNTWSYWIFLIFGRAGLNDSLLCILEELEFTKRLSSYG